MSDKLQKYLAKSQKEREIERITVEANDEQWSVQKLTTLQVRRSFDWSTNEDGTPKEGMSHVDVKIVMATEHEFPWVQLVDAYGVENKFQLPPLVFDDPEEYAKMSKAVNNFNETKKELIEKAKNSSGGTEKQAG
jgi:endonuclease V-like protein UPF0215 family